VPYQNTIRSVRIFANCKQATQLHPVRNPKPKKHHYAHTVHR